MLIKQQKEKKKRGERDVQNNATRGNSSLDNEKCTKKNQRIKNAWADPR